MRESGQTERTSNREFFTALARGFGGALIFSLPLLMTMEMWWLGFYMDRLRLSLFMILILPMLVGISHYAGIEPNTDWPEDTLDAFVAYAIAFAASAVILYVMNIITFEMPLREVIGNLSLQAIPASFGAIIATGQLGQSGKGQKEKQRKEQSSHGGELFFMSVGAVFLAFNVAPTEEMVLIAYKMTHWHATALAVLSLFIMHAFVYAVDFRGEHEIPEGTPQWSIFLRYTTVGYAITLLISAYVLWTFGRFEEHALSMYVMITIVLGFPASIGAAAARLFF